MTDIEGIVNISKKPVVERRARASGKLWLSDESVQAIKSNSVKKGNVLEASTIAAIQAVKDTPRIVPHCHPVPIEGCRVNWSWQESVLVCEVDVNAHYKTGIEMEALTGVMAGLLCAWDMVKSLEKDEQGQYPNAKITDVVVLEKFKSE